MDIIEKESIDLIAVIKRAGIELKCSGSRHTALCPFHEDQTPSFFVFPDGHWRCFSCQIGGDAIDFVMLKYGLSFQDAFKHLGIEQGKLTPQKRQEIKHLQQRRGLVKAFREWEARGADYAALLCRSARKLLGNIKTEADLEKYGELYHGLESWQYHLDILIGNDDQVKLGLYDAGTYA